VATDVTKSAVPEPAGLDRGIAIEHDVPARMRDGVVLRADVYRPASGGPWPTLLMRTPYNKRETLLLTLLDPLRAARAGFMIVLQDTRGRFASDGEWLPFKHERPDGHDTVEWAARLPAPTAASACSATATWAARNGWPRSSSRRRSARSRRD